MSQLQAAVLSVCPQTARYGSRLRPALMISPPTPTSNIKGGQCERSQHLKEWRSLEMQDVRRVRNNSSKKGAIHQNPNTKTAPSLTVGCTGNVRTNPSKRGRKWAALTLTAVKRGGGGHSKGLHVRPHPSHKSGQHLTSSHCRGGRAQESIARNAHAHRTITGSN